MAEHAVAVNNAALLRYKVPCPLPIVHRERKEIKKGKLNVQQLKNDLRNYFWNVASNYCMDTKNVSRVVKCAIMHEARGWLDDGDIDSLLDYLFDFSLKERKDQRILIVEWMKYGVAMKQRAYNGVRHDNRKLFLIPGVNKPEAMICTYALCALLGMTHNSWDPLWKKVKDGLPIEHGLTGKVGNKRNVNHHLVLTEFFEEMKAFAGPRATRLVRGLVRNQVNIDLRDDDEEVLELPTCFTKQGLYNHYLLQLGWTFTYDNNGKVVDKTASSEDLPNPASWPTFLSFWNESYPKLVIPNPAEDICNECFRFANQHKFATTTTRKETSEDSSDNDVDQQEGENNDSTQDDIARMEENELLILRASNHVRMAQNQRLLYQEKRQAAVDTRSNRPSERILCYVGDYAQNLYIPNFASEQPGETYYFSPLSCYCFGMVDCSTVPTKLTALLYTEDVGKKGGNNVASLIWLNLKRLGVVGTLEPFKEINIVMDNCGGQNKNRMVLRLLHYLVKKKIAVDARIIFLVRGHTKNDCDRLFNTMKKEYRKSNVYTPVDLEGSIKHDLVDTVTVDHTAFRDWDTQEDGIIERTKDIKAHHCFLVSANRDNGNTMYMESDNNSGREVARQLVKPMARDNDVLWQTLEEPEVIPPAEVLDIKWKELYNKWGKYIPEEKKKQWKYYSEDPGPARRKLVRKHTKESKTTRKGRTRTAEDDVVKPKKPKEDPNEDDNPSFGII